MEILSEEQILEKIKNPDKQDVIKIAMLHQNRLSFHSVEDICPSERNPYKSEFFKWVSSFLPLDKFQLFTQLLQTPIETIELTDNIFVALHQIWNGRNGSFNFTFTEKGDSDDWNYYYNEVLGGINKWRDDSWQTMISSINAFLVVDMPINNELAYDEKIAPYYYFLPISEVIDYSINPIDKSIKYIIFWLNKEKDKIAVIDSNSYRAFKVKKKEHEELSLTLISDNPHDLKYTPVTFFWNDMINPKIPDIKKSPLDKVLAQLDWLLYFMTSKKHLDLYACYPIYSAYEDKCDYHDEQNDVYCDGGFLRRHSLNDAYIYDADNYVRRCPVCSTHKLTGAGSIITIPIPSAEDDVPDLKNPISITTIDDNSLNYNNNELDRLKSNIYSSIVGVCDSINMREAVNETQIEANFEERTTVLKRLKLNFELALTFVMETICRLRYGESFIGSSVSLGTTFYISSVDMLYSKLTKAKESGASQGLIDSIQEQILYTEFANNDRALQRNLLLNQIEPFRGLTLLEVTDLYGKGLVSKQDVDLKINLSRYIDRFERENNCDITEFGVALPFNDRIDKLLSKLSSYYQYDKNTIVFSNY